MGQESYKVLIVGTYSGLNKGDRLMQKVVIDELQKIGMEPILSSPFPEIDRKIYLNTSIVKCKRRNLPISVMQCLLMFLMPERLRQVLASKNKELNDYLEAEYIVDTSGDMLTEDYGIHIAFSHAIPLIYCSLLKKKFFIIAQSIGPFRKLKRLFLKLLKNADLITARDSITYEYLIAQGLNNVIQTADLGFLLEPKKYNLNNIEVLQKRQNQYVLGICPSALFFNKFSKNFPNYDWINFCLMLDKVAKEKNVGYLLIPHVNTPNGKFDDDNFSMKMMEQLEANCSVIDSGLDPAHVKYIFSKLDGVVSFRMHGAIAALDSFVPTIAVAYSHKTFGLYESLGISDWAVSNDQNIIKNLEDLIYKLLDKSAEFRAQLIKAIPIIRERANKNLEILARMKH